MDSLANYGSDDEYEENSREKLGSRSDGSRYYSPEEADANYDEVQMDLSEESNNNNSNEEEERRTERSTERRFRTDSSRSREEPRSSERSNRHKDGSYRSKHDDDKEKSKKYESKSKYDEKRSSPKSRDDRNKERSRRHRSRSRERKRSNSREKKMSPSKEHKRSNSKEKNSVNKDRRRSNSKDRRRSNSREKRRSNSRERRRSISREKRRSGSKERRRSRSPRRSEFRRRSNSKERDRGNRYGKRFDRTSNKMAQLEKLGIEIKTPDAEYVTPQMLLQRSMDEQVQKIKNSTGIELPKYYNPSAMNPARYADQIQKRRLLWQKKDGPVTQPAAATAAAAAAATSKPGTTMGQVWEATTFAQDSDGKVASKFKRLMGIKDNTAPTASTTNKDILKKQEELFSSMEQQYEVARTATHTMRGVGLGFGSYQYPR